MSDFKNKKADNTYFSPLFDSKLRSPALIERFRWFSGGGIGQLNPSL
jgi:hypothetical protein